MSFLAGLVQLGGDDQPTTTVLGENQVAPSIEIATGVTIPPVTMGESADGTLTEVLKQPKTVNKFPTWAIILISLLGAKCQALGKPTRQVEHVIKYIV
jgi:hypothetical protein